MNFLIYLAITYCVFIMIYYGKEDHRNASKHEESFYKKLYDLIKSNPDVKIQNKSDKNKSPLKVVSSPKINK